MRPNSNEMSEEATVFVAHLSVQGFRLESLPDGRIRVQPASRLKRETADRIRSLRTSIVAVLSRPTWPCVRCRRFSYERPTVCYWCRTQRIVSA